MGVFTACPIAIGGFEKPKAFFKGRAHAHRRFKKCYIVSLAEAWLIWQPVGVFHAQNSFGAGMST